MSKILKNKFVLSVFTGILVFASQLSASQANEIKDYQYQTTTSTAIVSEYSRLGSSIQVTNQPLTTASIPECSTAGVNCTVSGTGNAIATVECTTGVDDGGWSAVQITGQCPDLTICYGSGTPAEVCFLYSGGTPSASDVNLDVHKDCASEQGSNKPNCVLNYSDASGVTGNTGDDMFRIDDGAGAFFVYKSLDEDDPYRLRYITRNGGNPAYGLMMPSGPNGTFTDYKNFLDNAPSFVTVESACYPVDIDVCAAPSITLQPVDGVCGAAHGAAAGTYASDSDIAAGDFCYIGNKTSVSNTSTQISWRCTGYNGGANSALCSVDKAAPYPVCGASVHNKYFDDAADLNSSGALCDTGTASGTPSGSGPWNWTCNNTTGDSVSCKAYQNSPPPPSCTYLYTDPDKPDYYIDYGDSVNIDVTVGTSDPEGDPLHTNFISCTAMNNPAITNTQRNQINAAYDIEPTNPSDTEPKMWTFSMPSTAWAVDALVRCSYTLVDDKSPGDAGWSCSKGHGFDVHLNAP